MPGRLGTWAGEQLAALPVPEASERSYRPSFWSLMIQRFAATRKRDKLRVGLLGSRRAGKSTFIVMLSKKLHQLVDGASLRAQAERPDGELLKEMEEEISRCLPTKEDKQVRLYFDWPFRRDGSAFEESGTLKHQLILTDFPGEWAAPDAAPEDRMRLVGHLRDVDGLMVVVDPTDLEAEEKSDRVRQQEQAVESMFKADGLDLGNRFKRSLAIVVTKRDCVSREMLDRLAERSGAAQDESLERTWTLCQQQRLTEEESSELGERLLELIFPGKLRELRTRLAATEPPSDSWWGRWLHRRSRPQFQVFAVSQLGFELGRQVAEHRAAVQDWECQGEQGERPEVRLRLDDVPTEHVEIHHPFTWLFNQIPAGCLHQANSYRAGPWRSFYRRSVHARFRGAPEVRQDRTVSRARLACLFAGVLAAGLLTQPAASSWQYLVDRQAVHVFLRDAAAGDLASDQLRQRLKACRDLLTKPLGEELNDLEVMLSVKEELDAFAAAAESGDDSQRIQASLSWLRARRGLSMENGKWPDDLKLFRKRIASPLPGVVGSLTEACQRERTRLAREDRRDDALSLVDDCLYRLELLRDGGDLFPAGERSVTVAVAEFGELRKQIRRGQLASELAARKQTVETAINKIPPDFSAAVFAVDSLRVDAGEFPEIHRDHQAFRGQLVESFWNHTKSKADQAIEDDETAALSGLLESFLQTPSLPDSRRAIAESYQDRLPDKRAAAKIRAALGHLQDNQLEEAWERLRAAGPDLDKAEVSTQRDWRSAAVKVKRRMDRLDEAISLLAVDQVRDEAWAKTERDALWKLWTDRLKQSIPRLLAQGEVAQAKSEVAKFLNMKSTCPENLQREIQQLAESAIPIADMEQSLQAARTLAETEPAAALQALLSLRADAPRVADAELLKQWRNDVAASYERLDRRPEAIKFLKQLSSDAALKDRLATTPETLEGIWDRHAGSIQAKFLEAQADKESRASWSVLWERRSGGGAEPTARFQQAINKFAAEQAEGRLKNLKESLKSLADADNYEEAFAAVRLAQVEFGPWLNETELGLDDKLKQLNQTVRDAKLEGAVKKLESAFESAPPEQLHQSAASLLANKQLSDAQRKRLTSLRDDNLTRWEKDAYLAIREELGGWNLSKTRELVTEYMARNCPFAEKRERKRHAAARDLQRWLDRFEQSEEYSIKAVRLYGLPSFSVYSNFDPAIEIVIGDHKIKAFQDNRTGDARVTAFTTGTTFKWKRGTPIKVSVWNDDFDKKGYLLGVVQVKDSHALPRIAARYQKIPVADHDYKEWASYFKNLRVRLELGGLRSAPELPDYQN
ncbi:MAG: hypothetical protein N2C14_16785 [Planctomycetales bacterium]